MALSDGAHAMLEDFSYFTLLHQPGFGTNEDKAPKAKEGEIAEPREGATTLFGIACTRQIRSDRLNKRSKSVTRSSVQKSVVVIINGVAGLGELRTRLGMVTEMWFGMFTFSRSRASAYAMQLRKTLPILRSSTGFKKVSFEPPHKEAQVNHSSACLCARSSTNCGIRHWSWLNVYFYSGRCYSSRQSARNSVYSNSRSYPSCLD